MRRKGDPETWEGVGRLQMALEPEGAGSWQSPFMAPVDSQCTVGSPEWGLAAWLPSVIWSVMWLYNRKSLYASQLSCERLSRACKMLPHGQAGPGRARRGLQRTTQSGNSLCDTWSPDPATLQEH